MRHDWEPEELIEDWTLLEDDRATLRNKSGANRLGFAVLLKYFEIEARFPDAVLDVPPAAVDYVGHQVAVDPGEFAKYDFPGRTAQRHRAEIRNFFGFREGTEADQGDLAEWLAGELCPVEFDRSRLAMAVAARCRAAHIEPPAAQRIERLVASAVRVFEDQFCSRTAAALTVDSAARLEDLIAESSGDAANVGGGRSFFNELKQDPGAPGLESLLAEISKLQRVRAVGLPETLFDEVSERLVAVWRTRAAKSYPSALRASAPQVRLTLLAALCHTRTSEITDSLVELFIELVLRINTRAEKKVESEFVKEAHRVRGKEAILFRVAEAALSEPGGTVRKVIFPVAGESTLRALAAEAHANEMRYRARVRTVLRSSYSNHWRRMLHPLLSALEFRCNNTEHRPVMDAVDLLKRYLDLPVREESFFAEAERVPIDGVVPKAWREAVVDERGRVERIPYELCVLVGLRDAIRRREVWVVGADRWRDPEHDLPPDFEDNRDVHYDAIRQPLDATAFTTALEKKLRDALTRLDRALGEETTGGVQVTARHGEPWLKVPKLSPLEEPSHLDEINDVVCGNDRGSGLT